MQLQTLFPLVVAVSELKNSSYYKQALIRRILELREASDNYVNADRSWTGDVHGVDTLHNDSEFAWLSEQVALNVLQYLDKLGHDLDKYDLYLQRSWPVIAGNGQAVTPHTHPTAHLSAVYYVSIPGQGKAGDLIFLNQASPNEPFEGVSSHMTNGYKKINKFNAPTAHFRPTEGQLIIFPSSANHAVEANQTDEMRISISYDLVLTARENYDSGRTPEFLVPSPAKWRKAEFKINQPPTTQKKTGKDNGTNLDAVPEMKPFPDPV